VILHDKDGDTYESTLTASTPEEAREAAEKEARDGGWEPDPEKWPEIVAAAPGQFHVHFRVVRPTSGEPA
jgi:hypothetical protein